MTPESGCSGPRRQWKGRGPESGVAMREKEAKFPPLRVRAKEILRPSRPVSRRLRTPKSSLV